MKEMETTMRKFSMTLLSTAAIVVAAMTPAFAQNTDPLQVLQSSAGLPEKIEACRQLVLTATPDAIPVLAPLLLDEKLAHMARYALEPMPYPEAGQALRDALGKTSGLLKVGVISSLATRKDTKAIPDLAKLVSDSDAAVAQAAAKALGDIGTPEAADALLAAIDGAPTNRVAICDALVMSAELLAAGNPEQAKAIYDRLSQLADASNHVRTAALRGAVLTREDSERVPLLADALRGDDEALVGAALRVMRELKGNDAVAAGLAKELPALPDARKLQVLAAYGSDDAAAGPAVLAEAEKGSTDVRVAAIQAVTRMGYDPALSVIEQLASDGDDALAEAARKALAYFPGGKGDSAILAMLERPEPEQRRIAVELIGAGALEDPIDSLMKSALQDADDSVRVAALTALQASAGVEELPQLLDSFMAATSPEQIEATRAVLAAITERQKRMPGGIVIQKAVYGDLPNGQSEEMTTEIQDMVLAGALTIEASNANFGDPAPGAVKRLRVDYTENGTPVSKTVREGETLKLAAVSAPPAVVDAFYQSYEKAQGDAKLALIRLLGSTGGQKAFDAVQAAASSQDADVKAEALRTLCDWPTPIALPTLIEYASSSTEPALRLPALRGAVRLMGDSNVETSQRVADYGAFLAKAASPEEKMVVLSGLGQVSAPEALNMALAQIGDASIKNEAVQTAINIARNLGASAAEDTTFFNGNDISGWSGNSQYWKVEDGAIVGHSDTEVPKNEFLWSNGEVGDFYLVVDVMLDPDTTNAGIQFRSQKVDESGQAKGYQADIGKGYWGRLYHEHGRGMLDDTDAAEKSVKPGEWNRYEILAVGPAIWTAINGTVGTAYVDTAPDAERTGKIAFQIHSGPPLSASYRVVKLVHNPKIELEHMKVEDLMQNLRVSGK